MSTIRNRCPACGKLVPRGHGRKSNQDYCDRECWQAKPPKLARLEQEFNEPFTEVIKGFAEMGYSISATAEILGFNRKYFSKVINDHQLRVHFKPQAELRPECRGKGASHGAGIKRPGNGGKIRYSNGYLLQQIAAARNSMDFRITNMIDLGTVSNRFGSWGKARKLAERMVANVAA